MSGVVTSTAFALGYQISPIILVGGIATALGGMLPIVALTEGVSVVSGLVTGSFPSTFDQFFAQFTVIPSGKLISQQVAKYSFANQSTAANAVITDPLTVSVRMDCPAKNSGDYLAKLAVLTALQATLSAHNASGGLYTVATPGFIYTNCIMRQLIDISGAGSSQVQYQYQFDFEQPLVTLQAAQQAYSALLNKIAGGTQISGIPSWSSISNSISGAVSGVGSGIGQLFGGSAIGNFAGQSSPISAAPGIGFGS